jgi:group II intron reverse transcriptase/maturase
MLQTLGNTDGIQKLEVVRQRNKKRGWINRDLYRSLMYEEDLYEVAYQRVKSFPGNMTPGSDGETLDGFSKDEIKNVIQELRAGIYRPKPVRRTYIPKSNGKLRKLGIPCVRDKIVQEVVRMVLEAIYDSPHGPYFSDQSHGFRRERSCHTALRQIREEWSGVSWIIEGDISQCFDDIDHEILISILKEKITDERFINLIRSFLRAGYMDLKEVRKDSLAGTPQGGIVSPILSNIYLDKLDQYIERLRKELDKGVRRRHNPEYRRLQDRRLRMIKQGKTRTEEFRKLSVEMRQLPSRDPQDPGFVRVKYVRYADDWCIGIAGSRELAEEIKIKVGEFLKSQLNLMLSSEKTTITNARAEEAKFLGYRFYVGSTEEQKQTKTTNRSGIEFKRRSTGMQIILKAPMDELVKKLTQKGFCDAEGKPIHRAPWTLLDEDQIVLLYSSINRGIQNYYRPANNWARVQRLEYILKYSLAKTLAAKRKGGIGDVIENNSISVTIERSGKKPRVVKFYENEDWTIDGEAFSENRKVDIVQMNLRLRTKSKLDWPCCICGDETGIQMHHVRHLRKMSEKKAEGFTRIMAALNRKQIPVCARCHDLIHRGKYDGLALKDLAYDPSLPYLARKEIEVKVVLRDYLEDWEKRGENPEVALRKFLEESTLST